MKRRRAQHRQNLRPRPQTAIIARAIERKLAQQPNSKPITVNHP